MTVPWILKKLLDHEIQPMKKQSQVKTLRMKRSGGRHHNHRRQHECKPQVMVKDESWISQAWMVYKQYYYPRHQVVRRVVGGSMSILMHLSFNPKSNSVQSSTIPSCFTPVSFICWIWVNLNDFSKVNKYIESKVLSLFIGLSGFPYLFPYVGNDVIAMMGISGWWGLGWL